MRGEIQASEKNLKEFSTRSPTAHQLPVTGSQEIGQNWARVRAKVWELGC